MQQITPQYQALFDVGKLLLAEANVERILHVAVDQLIALSAAERGMIILFDEEGAISFQTARNLKREDIAQPEFEISRTIIEKVKTGGKPLLLLNALEDPQLKKSASVERLAILSVICLPLRHQGRVFGCIYLDNRSLTGVFEEGTFSFVAEFSDFISLAAYRSLECNHLHKKVQKLEEELRRSYAFEDIIGSDQKIVDILKLVSQIASSEATVLIQGESGTGKELIARALHFNSERRDRPFVPVNCAALPDNLLESELFGHVRGAFTGAVRDKKGWFERADGGTIFLDEVGEMSSALQGKLLRVLQTGEYSRLGATAIRSCDVRVLAATSRDLHQLVKAGQFREEVYYRLNVIEVALPALRERKGDIPLLARHFLKVYGKKYNKNDLHLSAETDTLLKKHDYPGNIRELENIMQRAVVLADGDVIEPRHLPAQLCRGADVSGDSDDKLIFKEAKRQVLEQFEREYIVDCLRASQGNITAAARAAGMNVKNFHVKMGRHGIDYKVYRKD